VSEQNLNEQAIGLAEAGVDLGVELLREGIEAQQVDNDVLLHVAAFEPEPDPPLRVRVHAPPPTPTRPTSLAPGLWVAITGAALVVGAVIGGLFVPRRGRAACGCADALGEGDWAA